LSRLPLDPELHNFSSRLFRPVLAGLDRINRSIKPADATPTQDKRGLRGKLTDRVKGSLGVGILLMTFLSFGGFRRGDRHAVEVAFHCCCLVATCLFGRRPVLFRIKGTGFYVSYLGLGHN
jgi:hypothetical protein